MRTIITFFINHCINCLLTHLTNLSVGVSFAGTILPNVRKTSILEEKGEY